MSTVIIVQARMSSSRLPGKVLRPVLGKPLLAYMIERLKRTTLADQIVVATTVNACDDAIVELCRQSSIGVTRGSEDDVLSRYFDTAVVTRAETVIRVTADCPLLDPILIDESIRFFKENAPQFDYVSNSLSPSYPRGMDVEVFSFRALKEAHLEASLKPEREHVTPFLYTHPERYRIGDLRPPKNLSEHRWTVDTIEDYQLVSRIIEALYPQSRNFSLEDILTLFDRNPDWKAINAMVRQKEIGE